MGVSHSRGLTKPPLRPSYFVFTAKEAVLSQVVTEITSSSLSDVISIPLCGHFARARDSCLPLARPFFFCAHYFQVPATQPKAK